MKYTVFLSGINFSNLNKSTREEFVFESENPLQSRNEALEKVLELKAIYSEEMKNKINTNSDELHYDINLWFEDDDLDCLLIGDDKEESIEGLRNELYHYQKKGIEVETMMLNLVDEDEVIATDLLLNSSF